MPGSFVHLRLLAVGDDDRLGFLEQIGRPGGWFVLCIGGLLGKLYRSGPARTAELVLVFVGE